MKKELSLFLSLVIALGVCISAPLTIKTNAATVDNLTFTLNEDGQSYSVSACSTSASGELTIPSEYNDLPITSIGDSAFYKCKSLTCVTICDGVRSIGEYAFSYCTSLISITIPNTVTSIDDSAFYNSGYYNNSLNWENDVLYIGNHLITAKTSLPNNYTIKSGTICIANYAFEFCYNLISVTIPSSVTSIGYRAFDSCEALTNVKFGAGVKSIGSYAFEWCDALTSVTLPNSIESIGYAAFSNCISLKSVTIPNNLSNIGAYAFYNTVYYNDIDNWDNDVLYIGNHLIEAKNTLAGDYVIKEGTKCIAEAAFYKCNLLTGITIPDCVTSIDNNAFESCESLAKVTIGNGVINIGEYTFYNTAYYKNDDNWESCILYIGSYIIDAKDTLSGNYTIKDSTKCIAENAFYDCSSLKCVFYVGSSKDWNNITVCDGNTKLASAMVHYNATYHSYNISINKPLSDGEYGSIEDTCSVCGFVHRSEKLVWVNNFITAIDTKNAVVDTTSNTLLLDMSACQDITEAIVEMDGYTLTTIPTSSYGFIGTGSKVQVADSTGTQVAEYTLVVRGDVNGDSVCDSLDLMLIELARHESNNVTLEGAYFTAANLAEDSEINMDDFNAVVNRAVA